MQVTVIKVAVYIVEPMCSINQCGNHTVRSLHVVVRIAEILCSSCFVNSDSRMDINCFPWSFIDLEKLCWRPSNFYQIKSIWYTCSFRLLQSFWVFFRTMLYEVLLLLYTSFLRRKRKTLLMPNILCCDIDKTTSRTSMHQRDSCRSSTSCTSCTSW